MVRRFLMKNALIGSISNYEILQTQEIAAIAVDLLHNRSYERRGLAVEPGHVQRKLSPQLHLLGCTFQFLRYISEEEERSWGGNREQAGEVACRCRLQMIT